MTLDRLRPIVTHVLRPFVEIARSLGLTPHMISWGAFLLAVAAGVAFGLVDHARWLNLLGATLVFLSGWFDLVDGALARRLEVDSAAGDLLDHVLDRYADIVVIAGLAAGGEHYALGFAAVTGVLMTSYLGTQAEAIGLDRVYAGILGRADRLALIGIAGIVAYVDPTPWNFDVIVILLGVFAVVGHVTAVQRFLSAWDRVH